MVWSASVNLTKGIVGSGVLCLPYGLHIGGFGLGLISLVTTGSLALIGFLAVGHACHHTGARTYREACVRSVGLPALLVDVMVVLECIITNVGYTLLILDYSNIGLNGLFGVPVGTSSRATLAIVVTASVILPLSLKENLYALRFSSLIGVCAVGYAIIFVIVDSASRETRWDFIVNTGFLGSEREGIFRAVSIMTSALSFHYNAPAIWVDLADHPAQWNSFAVASIASFSISTVVYVMFATAGFASFGSMVQGNLLMGYKPGVLVLLAWIGQAVNLTVCFPLVLKPARDTVMQSFGFLPPSMQAQDSCTLSSWTMATMSIVLCVVGVAVILTDISRVQAFRGALLGSPLCFVLPGLMLISRHPRDAHNLPMSVAGFVLVVFGTISGVVGLFCAVCV